MKFGSKAILTLSAVVLSPILGFASSASVDPNLCSPPNRVVGQSFDTLYSEANWFAHNGSWSCAEVELTRALQIRPDSWKALNDLGALQLREHKYRQSLVTLQRAAAVNPGNAEIRRSLAHALRGLGDLGGAELQLRKVAGLEPGSVRAYDELASLLNQERLYSSAITYWDKALAIDPDDAEIAVSRAQALSDNDQPEEAIASLQAFESRHPSLEIVSFSLGTVLARQKRFKEAEREFEECVRTAPNDSSARLSLGRIFFLEEDYSQIPPLLEPLLTVRGEPEVHYLVGASYKNLGRYAEAEAQLRLAAHLAPSDEDAQFALGATLIRTQKPAEALSHLRKAVELDPQSEAARLQMAIALKMIRAQKQSSSMYQEVRETEKTNLLKNQFATQGLRANELLKNGRAVEAEAIYRSMLQIFPEDAHTYYNLAITLGLQNRKEEGRAALERSIHLDPEFPLARTALGSEYMLEGRSKDASTEFRKALELDPQITEAQLNLATILQDEGRMTEAASLLQRAIESSPNSALPHLHLGLLQAAEGKLSDATLEVQKAVDLEPNNIDALITLAKIFGRTGKMERSVAFFKRVVSLEPGQYVNHLNLGIALADHLEVDAAEQEFREAVRLGPDSSIAHYNLGRLLLDERKSTEAAPELQHACDLDPSLADGFYLLAVAKRQSGDLNLSLSLVQRSIELDPGQARSFYLLGQNLLSLGRNDEAVASWKKAIQINPNSTEVLYKLTQIMRDSDPQGAEYYATILKSTLAKQRATNEADTLGNLALAAADRHDYDQAIEQFAKALDICGDCKERGELKKDLGLIEARSGATKDAARTLREAADLAPNDPDVSAALAVVLSQLGTNQ